MSNAFGFGGSNGTVVVSRWRSNTQVGVVTPFGRAEAFQNGIEQAPSGSAYHEPLKGWTHLWQVLLRITVSPVFKTS